MPHFGRSGVWGITDQWTVDCPGRFLRKRTGECIILSLDGICTWLRIKPGDWRSADQDFSLDLRFYFLALFDLFIMVLCFFYLPETKTATPEKQQAPLLKITLKDYLHAITNSQFMINVLGGFFAYCIVISYNVMTPFLVQDNFNLSPDEYGYLAVLIGAPYYLAALMNRQMVLKHGIYFSCMLGSILILTAGAAMLFANLNGYQNIYVLIIPFMIATFGQALIFSNTIASALQLFPATSGGRMSALYSSLQMILVSLTSTYFARLPDNNTIYLATVVLCMGGFCLIFILLSEKIRQKQLAKAAVV